MLHREGVGETKKGERGKQKLERGGRERRREVNKADEMRIRRGGGARHTRSKINER
jgi:hypothetical protein